MSTAWGGGAPVSFTDLGDYELGEHYVTLVDITITDLRLFGGDGNSFGGRTGRVWTSTGSSALSIVSLPTVLTSGWALYALPTPLAMPAGTDFWVSYSTQVAYGFLGGNSYPVNSADNNVQALGAAFHDSPTNFPNTPSSGGFFGVDFAYSVGIAGNQPPVAGLGVTMSGMDATAVVTVIDEVPSNCTVKVEWGDGTVTPATGPQTLHHTYQTPGTYPVLVTVTDPLGLVDAAAGIATAVLPDTSLPFVVGIDAQREATAMMIADDPTTISLIPRVESTSRTGGQFWDDGPARPAQTFKLIAMTYSQKPVVTVNGKERVVDYTLLGTWDCQMEIGDHWTGDDGRRYEVVAFAPGFGYERKGLVECHG